MKPGPGPERRRGRTRARLLAAAFQAFAVNGYGRVTIAEICAGAGFSRGAFFSNFESLDELFLALYEERAAELRRRVATVLPHARTTASGSRDRSLLTEQLSRVMLSEPDRLLFETDVRAYAARRPAAARVHRAVRRELAETVLDTLTAPCEAPLPRGWREEAIRSVLEAYDAVTAQLVLDGDADRARERLAQLLHVAVSLAESAASRPVGPPAAQGG
ncbi:helix-turn-helix domain-containing protein [Streptomyces lavenduligriseus]|uniref:TetR/AcrR family transcriptional regulator n=1 Tax=Streptomyces lavenduligriseus TaxID=67315 RepID=A0ABT0NKR8_9ACTN|nr:TetR/AcrR family transcriptional regulator [Streptomyces lavenduligriseus]MCL3992064.1 TetR/AcrR family transcriptional regulator [Streptomyces lavenduligriseus]